MAFIANQLEHRQAYLDAVLLLSKRKEDYKTFKTKYDLCELVGKEKVIG